MFRNKEKPRHQRLLEEELERILSVLPIHQGDTPEYGKLMTMAERIHEMLPTKNTPAVSPDTLVTVAANLMGIFMIIKHEDVNVITSKALGFVIRVR